MARTAVPPAEGGAYWGWKQKKRQTKLPQFVRSQFDLETLYHASWGGPENLLEVVWRFRGLRLNGPLKALFFPTQTEFIGPQRSGYIPIQEIPSPVPPNP